MRSVMKTLIPTFLLFIFATTLTSCIQGSVEPGEIQLVSKNGYILADSQEALHDKVIDELQVQFGLESEVFIQQTIIKEHKAYVLALIEFGTETGDEGNMLFILHRDNDQDFLWTKATKYTTLACSDSLGCKLDLYEDAEEIAVYCIGPSTCEDQTKSI